MNIGRSEYTRLVQNEVKLKKAISHIISLKEICEMFILEEEEIKILIEIDGFLKE